MCSSIWYNLGLILNGEGVGKTESGGYLGELLHSPEKS